MSTPASALNQLTPLEPRNTTHQPTNHQTNTLPDTMSEVVPAVHRALCPLLDTLPIEIRMQIYEYILFENGSFFSLDDEQEGNSVPTLFPKLRAPPRPRAARRQNVGSSTENGQQPQDPQRTAPNRDNSGNIMALLTVSKQMYAFCCLFVLLTASLQRQSPPST